MKPVDKAVIFIVPASVLLLLGVFARILGLSEATGLVLFFVALALMLMGYRETTKPRAEAGENFPPSNFRPEPGMASAPGVPAREILPTQLLQPRSVAGSDADRSPDK